MSTSVLNSGGNLEPTASSSSNRESSPSPGSSSESNSNVVPTTSSSSSSSSTLGAPTSVLVAVHGGDNTDGPNTQSTSAGSSSGSITDYEPLLRPQSSIIQISSSPSNRSGSSSSSSSESTTNPDEEPILRTASDVIKRTFDLIKELDPNGTKSYSVYCKRLKTSLSSSKDDSILSVKGDNKPYGVISVRYKLEQRLNGILCCAVCLDLPTSYVYQCSNGHLMCAGCFTHVLADARLRDEAPTCPSCRVSISKETCQRNLAVEKAVCELPGECRFCQLELPRLMLEKHMTETCEERIVPCRFEKIGCPWNGPFHEENCHAQNCIHPEKPAGDVLDYLEDEERKQKEQRKVHETLYSLLSYEKIYFHDVQFRPYRTDEYIHKLFYETSKFTAFNLQWVIKAKVNEDKNKRDPTQICERRLSFQLCLKSKINNAMTIHYMLLKGPHGDVKLLPMIYKFEFTEQNTESTYNSINLEKKGDSNRLLAAKVINFRLIMFQATK